MAPGLSVGQQMNSSPTSAEIRAEKFPERQGCDVVFKECVDFGEGAFILFGFKTGIIPWLEILLLSWLMHRW